MEHKSLKTAGLTVVAVGVSMLASAQAFADSFVPQTGAFSGATEAVKDGFSSTVAIIGSAGTFIVVVVATKYGRGLLSKGLRKMGF